ncbi:histone-like nucleoid-structuring protein Lsr2 [Streptomyces sp. NPDC019937]|uniref:Lsr2 family DNA-binding protein n=1 Tax=Streptomyces sp. NPDC019937 TaxID=3154787 RepID=UPI0033F7F735
MTIAALRRLLDEAQPDVPRHPAPQLPHQNFPAKEEPAVQTTNDHQPEPPAPQTEEQPLPVSQLLAWADGHPDPDVQDQGARARAALTGLRARHAADTELAHITEEAEQLEQRLAELRAREDELRPTARKKPRKAVERDYEPAVVRAWAKQQGIECSPIGRVPGEIVDRWRAAGRPQPLQIAS